MNTKNLGEKSKSYYSEAEIYDVFSQREDAPAKIYRKLLPEIKGKVLLDVGCGSGKYTELFAPFAKRVFAIDASASQLRAAKEKADRFENVDFIRANAEKINLPDQSAETAIACWMLGTVQDDRRKANVLKEITRILKPGGRIFLVENAEGGQFEEIRGRTDDPSERTKKYNDWLVKKQGFEKYCAINTYFDFKNTQEAKKIMGGIWGNLTAGRINDKIIRHEVDIYYKNI